MNLYPLEGFNDIVLEVKNKFSTVVLYSETKNFNDRLTFIQYLYQGYFNFHGNTLLAITLRKNLYQ